MININSKIYVAGHRGLVGSAIIRKLNQSGYKKVIVVNKKQLDLTDQSKVYLFLKKKKPDFIFIAAAKVGGIYSNNRYKAEFIYENLAIQTNLIHSAYLCGIKDLIFLGSSCVYPRQCKQPIKEEYLLSGPLEKTNDAYAIAKIAGIKMCQSYNEQYKTNYKCLMPTNTYGPNDNYDPLNSHFLPSIVRKVHLIKKKKLKHLILWGNGKSERELIYVDDLADACIHFMKKKTKHHLINIGSGKYFSIEHYAKKILKILIPNKKVMIKYEKLKLNGTPKKVLDVSLAKKLGWYAKSNFENSIIQTYKSFLKKIN
jgi:GDP-L-fucose synthase